MKKRFVATVILLITLVFCTMLVVAEKNQRKENKLIDFANKIGIPLKTEEVQNPTLFFRTYGLTIILSLIILGLLIFVIIPPTKKLIHKEISSIKKQIHKKISSIKKQKILIKKPAQKEKQPIKRETVKETIKDYHEIRARFKKIPKETRERVKLEVTIGRKIVEEKGMFSVAEVLKKIDEIYKGELLRQERLDLYEDIKRWTDHGEMCQLVKEEKEVKYFKFV